MKYGNWIPISKEFLNHLPKNRAFTKLEAAFSLQCDNEKGARVTISGYVNLWKWSFGKVYRFLDEMGVEIKYPESTQKRQNQNGVITNKITERSAIKNGVIRLIDSKYLQAEAERCEEKNGEKTERSRTTTKDPNTNKEHTCPFETIKSQFNNILGNELSAIRVFTEERKRVFRQRWKEAHKSPTSGLQSDTLEFWEAFFKYVKRSPFLMGNNNNKWRPDFDWLIKKKNFIKIFEGTKQFFPD